MTDMESDSDANPIGLSESDSDTLYRLPSSSEHSESEDEKSHSSDLYGVSNVTSPKKPNSKTAPTAKRVRKVGKK
jgi:hypothetical protein